MTTLVAWMASTLGRTGAVYLASDSRITWSTRGRWDAGRKLFACRTSPDIFGFCGDALFASQVLGQIVDLVDNGLLFHPRARPEKRHAAVYAAIQASHRGRHKAPDGDFQIVHVSRHGENADSNFQVWATGYTARTGAWEDSSLVLDAFTPIAFGSGAKKFIERLERRTRPKESDVNRAAFSAFCDSLAEETDAASGGVPQLVGLYGSRPAQTFGIVYEGVRYLHGLPTGAVHAGRLEWRDRDFQSIDGRTLQSKKLVRRQDRARTVKVRPR
jgi:hypothetical protein